MKLLSERGLFMNDIVLRLRDDEVALLKHILAAEQSSSPDTTKLMDTIKTQTDVCRLMIPFTVCGKVESANGTCLKKIYCMAEDASDAELHVIEHFQNEGMAWTTIFIRVMESRDFCIHPVRN